MNAQSYVGDFARFMRQGHIGAEPSSLELAFNAQVVPPTIGIVRGRVLANRARVRTVQWRMRGELVWAQAALLHDEFTVRSPVRAGTLEVRAAGVSPDGEEVIAWGFVELAWPAPEVEVELPPEPVYRRSHVHVCARLRWVRHVELVRAGAVLARHDVADGGACAHEFALPASEIGEHRLLLVWQACDGSEGRREILYRVAARPIQLVTQKLRGGGLLYRTQHAEAIELHVPGLTPLPLPPEGVIEGTFLAPVHAVLRYRDEGGEWRSESIRLDYAPPSWPQPCGFQNASSHQPSN